MRVEKPSSVPFVFRVFSTIQRKTKSKHFCYFCSEALQLLNHAHVPGQQMRPSPGPWPDSKSSKTAEVGCSCSELKPCQREIATDKIQKKIVESTAI